MKCISCGIRHVLPETREFRGLYSKKTAQHVRTPHIGVLPSHSPAPVWMCLNDTFNKRPSSAGLYPVPDVFIPYCCNYLSKMSLALMWLRRQVEGHPETNGKGWRASRWPELLSDGEKDHSDGQMY